MSLPYLIPHFFVCLFTRISYIVSVNSTLVTNWELPWPEPSPLLPPCPQTLIHSAAGVVEDAEEEPVEGELQLRNDLGLLFLHHNVAETELKKRKNNKLI